MNDQEQFREHIRQREWYDAAVILLKHTSTREDPQDWLSSGDDTHMMTQTIEQLASEWDAIN